MTLLRVSLPQQQDEPAPSAAAQQVLATCHLIISAASAALAAASAAPASGLPDGVASPAPEPQQLLLTALQALQRLTGAPRPVLAREDLQDLTSLLQGTLEGVLGPALLQMQDGSTRRRPGEDRPQDMTAHFAVCCGTLQTIAASSRNVSSGNELGSLDELIARAALTAISIVVGSAGDSSSGNARGSTGGSSSSQAEERLAGAVAAAFAAAQRACARSGNLKAPLVCAALSVLQTCRAGATLHHRLCQFCDALSSERHLVFFARGSGLLLYPVSVALATTLSCGWCSAEASLKAAHGFLLATLPSLTEGTPQNGAAALTLQAATLGAVADATQEALSQAEAPEDGSSKWEVTAAVKLQLPLLVSLLASLGACLEQPDQALEPSAAPEDGFQAFAAAEGGEVAEDVTAPAEADDDRREAAETANGDEHTEGVDSTAKDLQTGVEGQRGTAQERPAADARQRGDTAGDSGDVAEDSADRRPAGDGDANERQPEQAPSATDLTAAVVAVRERCLQVINAPGLLVQKVLSPAVQRSAAVQVRVCAAGYSLTIYPFWRQW